MFSSESPPLVLLKGLVLISTGGGERGGGGIGEEEAGEQDHRRPLSAANRGGLSLAPRLLGHYSPEGAAPLLASLGIPGMRRGRGRARGLIRSQSRNGDAPPSASSAAYVKPPRYSKVAG